jgi:hypothetical protein
MGEIIEVIPANDLPQYLYREIQMTNILRIKNSTEEQSRRFQNELKHLF